MKLDQRVEKLGKKISTKPSDVLTPEFIRRETLRMGFLELCTCPGSKAGEVHRARIEEAAAERGVTEEEFEKLLLETPEPDGGRPWPCWPLPKDWEQIKANAKPG